MPPGVNCQNRVAWGQRSARVPQGRGPRSCRGPAPAAASGAHVENGGLSKTPHCSGFTSDFFLKKMKFEAM